MASELADLRYVGAADVYKGDDLAGRLTRGTDGTTTFRYDDDYVAAERPAVAFTLPVSAHPFIAAAGSVPPFFAGLLPEGARLTALTSALKTSADDMLSLLLAVGSDTVGDVRVVPSGGEPADPPAFVEVADWSGTDFTDLFAASVAVDRERVERVALPGAQEKVSAAMISFPVPGPHLGWILKLNPPGYQRLVENEAFFSRMADACGLAVAETQLVYDRRGRAGLLVRRFDRVTAEDGGLRRLAQEDACQLLGRYPADKYRVRTLEVAHVIAEVSDTHVLDTRELVRLIAFSYLIGNGDLHAKNISVGETAGGEVRLTPAYDLVSTVPYIANDVMALELEARNNRLRRRHFHAFAARVGLRPRAVDTVLDRLVEVSPAWIERIAEIGWGDRLTSRLRGEMTRRLDDLRRE